MLATISTVTVELLETSRLKDLYQKDEYFREIFVGLQSPEMATFKQIARSKNFMWKEERIYLKNRQQLAIPEDNNLWLTIL